MKKGLMMALGLGAVAGVIALRRGASRDDGRSNPDRTPTADTTAAPAATGREEGYDPLGGATHTLTPTEAQDARAAARQVEGKNTSVEREEMYDDLSDVATSGSQGNDLGQEDRNPIGTHT